ncbi:MAG: tRNA preQ1(34) S-adenosylmethionine ribosyltransferase-isomerase QueA [Pseudomonadota bacterium]
MKLDDFDFELPEALIATRPARPRTSARLLVAEGGNITDATVSDLGRFLKPGDRLILNNTKVIPARLTGFRRRFSGQISGQISRQADSVAKIDVTLLEPDNHGHWSALVRPLKKLREGEEIRFNTDLSAIVAAKREGQAVLSFNLTGEDFDAALNAAGAMPLPPYIETRRKADAQDRDDYQTVFAKHAGAVAAPTASLHFDQALLHSMADQGVAFSEVTLHVGAGTFLPVKVDDVTTHKMHAEWGEVSETAAEEIAATKSTGGRIIPVGTTALRLIESAARGGQIRPWRGETDIFIYPGFEFRITDALMTNFHLPKSTLIMLVSALMGQVRIREIYDHAVRCEYRFFSYGDSSLLVP